MTQEFKQELPCPFCNGTGKYTPNEGPRCAKCRGTGRLNLDCSEYGPRLYCDCQLGHDLKIMDERIKADEERKFDPAYTGGTT